MSFSSQENGAFETGPSRSSTVFKALVAVVSTFLFVSLLTNVVSLTKGMFVSSQKEVFLNNGGYNRKVQSPLQTDPFYQFVKITTDSDLVTKLKEFDIWSVQSHSSIPPVIFDNYPEELSLRSTNARKKIFLNSLLPSALIVLSEVEHEKKYLSQIYSKYDVLPRKINFDQNSRIWQEPLDQDEFQFINLVTKKYRTTKAETLLSRVDTVPVSLILAQGAIESSWGSSRFVREANNLFGIWTWKENGIIPALREEGKTHKVASYPSLIDSVRAYCLTINRVSAYLEFRSIRQETKDPMRLADKLYRYSQRGTAYVDEVKRVIHSNNLQMYDTCYLSEKTTL